MSVAQAIPFSQLEGTLTGEVLDDRYTLLDLLGRGGMGEVYRARHNLLDSMVAVKLIRKALSPDQAACFRFLEEARSIASLKSLHTVTVFDAGVSSDGLLYYAMELVDGRPLSRVLKEDGRLPCRRAARLALQVCESLEEAHKQGIVHSDIKPQNILVQETRGCQVARVVDFGIASTCDPVSGEAVDEGNVICGTPLYLSPEQIMGQRATEASDLYSLAAVLYEMLTGTPPFLSSHPVCVLLKHVLEEAQPASARAPEAGILPAHDQFLATALAKDPSRRFATVRDFRRALHCAWPLVPFDRRALQST